MNENFAIVNPCSDFGFKRVTKDTAVVCGFLNAVLELDPPVESVEIISPDLQATFHKGANFTVDLLCRAADGQLILIEMQNAYNDIYAQKAFVEFCRLVSSFDEKMPTILTKRKTRSSGAVNEIGTCDSEATELDSGVRSSSSEFWKRITRVITCVITNKRTDNPGLSGIVNEFEFLKRNQQPQVKLLRIDCRIVIICLANFAKEEKDLESNLDMWLYAFKDAAQTETKRMAENKIISSLSKVAGQVPALLEFYRALRTTNIPPFELLEYQKAMEAHNSSLSSAELDGTITEKLRTIRAMNAAGMGVDVIASIVKVNEETIAAVLMDSVSDTSACDAIAHFLNGHVEV